MQYYQNRQFSIFLVELILKFPKDLFYIFRSFILFIMVFRNLNDFLWIFILINKNEKKKKFDHWAEFGPRPWAQSAAACPAFASQKAEAWPGPRLDWPTRSPSQGAGVTSHP
jgi:hypothetical protein